MVKHENMKFLEIFEFNDLEGLHGLHCDCFVMELQLRHLVDSALLEHAETRSGEVSIHDLYREFAGLEAQGHLIPLDMEERRWVYARDALPTEMEDEPRSSWKKLTRVCISEPYHFLKNSGIRSLSAIEWKYCTNLVVLKLEDLYDLSGVLNFKDLIRLRSLTVKTARFSRSKFSIEGLEGLKTLTYFKMYCDGKDHGAYVGKLPAALKVVEVDATVEFQRNVHALWTNLVLLTLERVCTSDLDLRSCSSLQEVKLTIIHGLEILELGPSLQKLTIRCCGKLVDVCGLDRLVGLKSLILADCRRLSKLPSFTGLQSLCELEISGLGITEIPNLSGLEQLEHIILLQSEKLSELSGLTGLKRLRTLKCAGLGRDEVPGLDGLAGLELLSFVVSQRLSKLPSLTGLQCLRQLKISCLGITEIPNLSGLEQLEVVDASRNNELTSLQGFGDLRALKTIDLSYCKSLCRLSDMSKVTNLKVLDLSFSGVELHEEDIHMLEGLQALEPVLVASASYDCSSCQVAQYGLDFKRHKIMYNLSEPCWRYEGWKTWREIGWEEKDLHYPSAAGYLVAKGIEI